ncbi:hypothetical protein [Metamycoplasma buccale]|uniref:hypothetical protein n=1 Tax=Metamycoplasma buccale TaxID=55602 RepID=UPI00398F0353
MIPSLIIREKINNLLNNFFLNRINKLDIDKKIYYSVVIKIKTNLWLEYIKKINSDLLFTNLKLLSVKNNKYINIKFDSVNFYKDNFSDEVNFVIFYKAI